MKRRIAFALATLTLVLVLTTAMRPTAAIVYTPGITPSTSVYTQKFSIGGTGYKLVNTVYNVAGTHVHENLTYYVNGTLYRKLNPDVDVAANDYFDMPTIIAANLTTGGLLYGTPGPTINSSTTMIVAGANRTVNYFKQNPNFNASVLGFYLEAWWDKATGLSVKWNLWWPAGQGGPLWQNVTMVSTTAWSPSPPAPTPSPSAFSTTSILAIAGVGIVALVIGFLVGRSGKRKR